MTLHALAFGALHAALLFGALLWWRLALVAADEDGIGNGDEASAHSKTIATRNRVASGESAE